MGVLDLVYKSSFGKTLGLDHNSCLLVTGKIKTLAGKLTNRSKGKFI